MKHFTEARDRVINVIRSNQSIQGRIKRICLIWDIKGKLRLLFEGSDNEDFLDIKLKLSDILKEAAGPFWSEQVWIWSKESTQAEKKVYETAWNNAIIEDAGPPEVRILDRHYSKATWFAPPLSGPWPLNEKTPPILSFFSFKGGVGRTTALVSLAIQLSRSGKKVAVLDLDLEAPGLSAVLPGVEGRSAIYGVVDYLLERPLMEQKEIDLDDYYHLVDDPAIIGSGPPITVIPAGSLNTNYLEKLARIDYETLFSLHGGTISPLLELLTQVKGERKIDYMLLDARSGLHDLGGLALSGISHLDVLFGLDNEQSWRGMELVIKFLGQNRIVQDQKQLHCALVFALAPEPGGKREEAFHRFLERSHHLFSENYYDEADADPEEAWPLPGIDDSNQPHYPITIGFNPLVQRYDQIRDIVDYLTTGDFNEFAKLILERVGRNLP
jgi:hypothetical protein